ncbi:hypothetical protein GCM10023321_75010 [Pseudonocardia eucalypti]|uniref:Uncharacterized protein n=1 Tax=Pseudonocardia eucalypti TaxID=648755 RepID=A0ABP9R9A8_9PSEU|nr:hypothetical protein [Pseudonocardia eucalypti]
MLEALNQGVGVRIWMPGRGVVGVPGSGAGVWTTMRVRSARKRSWENSIGPPVRSVVVRVRLDE